MFILSMFLIACGDEEKGDSASEEEVVEIVEEEGTEVEDSASTEE